MFVTTDTKTAYEMLVAKGDIHDDPAQRQAVGRLQSLHEELDLYGQQMGRTGWRARLGMRNRKRDVPRGIYMWGGVGRGKTMLMDLFYDHANVEERKHVHFHAFMQEVHRRIHSFREAQKAGKVSTTSDPIEALSKVIIDQAWLLCFDEFHVTDIGDAMILGRLFEMLFQQGVVVVTTSNRHPKDLYKDGLQRERFLPFIDIFMEKMEVIELASETDYRLERLREIDIYLTPANEETAGKLQDDFRTLTVGVESHVCTLIVNGREISVPQAAEGVGFCTFSELCERPLGAGDYLEIAQCFQTLIVSGIPQLGSERRDVAKRFVTLIDALYDYKVKLICSADVGPTELYTKGDGAFEFERTVSRLLEMQSPEYLALAHGAKE